MTSNDDSGGKTPAEELLALIEGDDSLDTPAASSILERASVTVPEARELRRVRRELVEVAAFEADVEREALEEHRSELDRARPRSHRFRPWLLAAVALVVIAPFAARAWRPGEPRGGEPGRVLMGGDLRAIAPAGAVATVDEFLFERPAALPEGDVVELVLESLTTGARHTLDVTTAGGRARVDAATLRELGPRFEWRIQVLPREGGPPRKSNVAVVTLPSQR